MNVSSDLYNKLVDAINSRVFWLVVGIGVSVVWATVVGAIAGSDHRKLEKRIQQLEALEQARREVQK